MISVSLEALARQTNGNLLGDSVPLQGLAIDSRKVMRGDLFAAIQGRHVDGHDYANQAMAAGAAGLVTERSLEGLTPQLVVQDVVAATGSFGLLKRRAFSGEVIAVTGSAGKTTTKNLMAAALGVAGQVHATSGNQNNELGVPLTLAGLSEAHAYAVIEMGAGQPGDIAYLCTIAEPTVAICLNASAAHLAHYDSVDAIAATKGEIFAGLAPQGLAVMNADQSWLPQWQAQAQGRRQITFGLTAGADYRATDIQYRGFSGTTFRLTGPGIAQTVTLKLPGQQHVMNALAALAVAFEIGVDAASAVAAVGRVESEQGRGALSRRPGGGRVVDDTYNANPAAVRAAIDILARETGYRVLILGAMLELGDTSDALHHEVGRYARAMGIDQVLAVGAEAKPAAEGFGGGALFYPDQTALQAEFPVLPEDHIVWVKASRGAALEKTSRWLTHSGEDARC